MKHLSGYVDNAISILLLIVAGVTPLLFLNQTTEFFEMPKLVFLIVSTVVLIGLWIVSWILKGKVQITRTPLDLPLLLLLIVVILSTWFSASKYSAIYGNFPRVHGSAVAWITYIMLYFVTVSNLKSVAKLKMFLYAIFGSGALVAVVSLLSFVGLYLPIDFARAANFTPTGSSFSTVAFLLLLLPLPMLSIVNPNKYIPAPFGLILAILFSVTIALIGSVPAYVVMGLIFAATFFIAKPHQTRKYQKMLPMFMTPIIVVALTLALAYIPGNPISTLEARFPKEIQLPLATSWKVSVSAFRDAPYIGTGPSTYLFNFASYKPLEFNVLDFWNFSFDSAHNEYLQILGTLGILGLLAIVILSLSVLYNASKNMTLGTQEGMADSIHVLIPSLAVSGIVGVLLLAIHASTLVSIVATLMMFAALMASQKHIRERVMNLSLGLKASTLDDKQFDLFPVIIFVIYLAGAGFVLFRTYTATLADYYHRQALSQANRSGTATYTNLQKAEALNPFIDLYRVDMAQTNFALANAIATQKGPTAANPQGTLTDQDRRTIQTLLSQAINEGRVAVTLSPQSARNWEVLAAIYRNITGVAQNALTFSLDAYGRAIQRDPLNPALRISVGGIYYSVKNYDLAIRFFTDSANLKPNNANAYFNLAVALRDKGDLANAKLVAEQAVNLLSKNRNTQDYTIATTLLKEINDKIAAGGTTTTGTGLQGTNGQQSNLPAVDVDELGNPPTVSTPAAVRNNPNTNLPRLTTTPAPAATDN